MARIPNRPLTREDRERAIRKATRHLVAWHGDEISEGVNDDRLRELLERSLGEGGGCGPGDISYAYNGNGFRIWASWDICNSCVDEPIIKGEATLKMVRHLYNIPNPDDNQLGLF